MPANMMSAPLASTLVVMGRSNATVTAGPTPGSTPTAVPSMQPTRHHMRFCIDSATWKPCRSWAQTSMALRQQALKDPGRQHEPESIGEHYEDEGGQHEADDRVEQPAAA